VSELVAEAGAVATRLGLVEFVDRARSLTVRLDGERAVVPVPASFGGSARGDGVAPVAPRVWVLGRFACLDVDGNEVAWNSRKARALLKLLVDARGAHVPRDVLVERLWPGAAPSVVANRLSVAISTVRRSLDPRGVRPRSSFVGVDRDTVWLESSRVDVDLERFLVTASASLRQRDRARSADDFDRVLRDLQGSAALYGGVPFADDPYDDWWTSTRDEVRGTFSDVCHATAEVARLGGLDAPAAGALRAALDADPWDERAHRALVELHRQRGAHGLADLAEERYRSAMLDLAG
jgi:DNA-binding SARP family transcriptional activator